jgi:chaperonin GroEL
MSKLTETIIKGVNNIANTVKQTLGTKGRTILFNDENNRVHVTKDGVTVARHVMSPDQYENMVITVLREASLKTMKTSGDGTTTTMILAQFLTLEGLKLLNEGFNYYEMSKQMDEAVSDVTKYIQSQSIKIEDNESLLREIAAISSNDEKLGDFIYSIIQDIGLYGDIEVKESEHQETRVDKTKGMKLHKGWMENFMVNDTREMMFAANDCYILIIDGTIQAVTDIDRYIKYLMGKPLIVFCNEISDITLSQFQKLISSTGVPLCFVQNDGYGDRKTLLMNDLAALTSAYVIDSTDDFNPDNLGFAATVKVGEWTTSITGGDSDTELVEEIIEEIKDILEEDENDDETMLTGVERKFHRKRLANLTGGVAVIHVGGRTKVEMKELKDRFDDAVLAVESAIKQGVNVGGGSTYLNCQKELSTSSGLKGRGYKLIIDSLEAPFKQLLVNADMITGYDFYKSELLNNKALDLRDGKLYDLSEKSYRVFDPSSVLIDSLVNATSVAKSLLSMKNIIYDGQKLDE